MRKLISLLKTWLRISEVRKVEVISYSEVDLVQEYIYYITQQVKQGTLVAPERFENWIYSHKKEDYEHANGFSIVKNYDAGIATAELITGLSYLNFVSPSSEKYAEVLEQLLAVREDILNKWLKSKMMSSI